MNRTKRWSWLSSSFLGRGGTERRAGLRKPGGTDVAATAETQNPIIGGKETLGDESIVAVYGVKPGAEIAFAVYGHGDLAYGGADGVAHCVHPDLAGADAVFSVLTAANLTDKTCRAPA